MPAGVVLEGEAGVLEIVGVGVHSGSASVRFGLMMWMCCPVGGLLLMESTFSYMREFGRITA